MAEIKICKSCGRYLVDDTMNFRPQLKKGGKWGTTAKCRKCYNKAAARRRREKETVAKIKAMLEEHNDAA